MSLILEALKKLDREKQAPERGVVVLGATAWASRREGPRRWAAFLLADLALVAIGAAVAIWWLAPGGRQPARAPLPQAAATPRAAAPAAALVHSPPPPAYVQPLAPQARRAAADAPRVTPTPRAPRLEASPSPRPAPVAERPFVLQAVTEQDGVPVALINQRVVRVGDGFDGMHVVRIEPTEVEIEIEATGAREVLTF